MSTRSDIMSGVAHCFGAKLFFASYHIISPKKQSVVPSVPNVVTSLMMSSHWSRYFSFYQKWSKKVHWGAISPASQLAGSEQEPHENKSVSAHWVAKTIKSFTVN